MSAVTVSAPVAFDRPRHSAFGWAVREIDGHDMMSLIETLRAVPFELGRPNCLIAHTIKGRGVSFMENRVEWHHKVPSDAEMAMAMAELSEDSE